jgi:hypothetical protein
VVYTTTTATTTTATTTKEVEKQFIKNERPQKTEDLFGKFFN